MKARLLSTAESEILRSAKYYEGKQPGLGSEFIEEVEAAIRLIESYPLAWTPLSPRTRRCRTHRFPFGLFYEVRSDEILIVSVMDLRCDPTKWEQHL